MNIKYFTLGMSNIAGRIGLALTYLTLVKCGFYQ